MMRAATVLVAICLMGGPALAAGAARPECMSLAKAQHAAGKDTTITAMNRAQFHFLQGIYAGSPVTPEGLPPGDGALILSHDKGGPGLILWTRGVLACAPLPIASAANLLKLLAEVKSGATGDGDEM